MGYEEPEDGDAAYMIAPHINFERLVREGHVDDPKALSATRLLPACVPAYPGKNALHPFALARPYT
eukprot:1728642-Prymnesium_polylepis.1